MPFYQVDTADKKLQLIKPKNFTNEQWLEREHLQPLFRDNPQSINPNLFIISEEFTNWENSSRRIDLLALDEEANLVVIELKRVEDGGHMELQALRCNDFSNGLGSRNPRPRTVSYQTRKRLHQRTFRN